MESILLFSAADGIISSLLRRRWNHFFSSPPPMESFLLFSAADGINQSLLRRRWN
jgi:hypothetical protein